MPDPLQFTTDLQHEAHRLGFVLAGICPAVEPTGLARFYDWLEAGYHGQMQYLPDRAVAYAHPRHVLDGARSLLMLAFPYRTSEPGACDEQHARVSRYAWGRDYHDIIHERLRALADWLHQRRPAARVRGVVDTAPLLEREFAQAAGLGWIGKNTLLLNRDWGSWFFLAALLTDLELTPDEPQATDHCGTCRACLDACPTGAFVDAYQLDARRCLSYLTIELRGPIPVEFRGDLDPWLFGCDICQDVCPWNHRVPIVSEPEVEPRDGADPMALAEWFTLSDDDFRRRFRDTPLWRAKRRGLLRNAALVLGGRRADVALAPLRLGLNDVEPLVRGASAWALGKLESAEARDALRVRQDVESDADVWGEIEAALSVV